MIAASSGSNDVVAAAFVAGALALGAHAGRSTAALAVAGWVKLGAARAVPLWVARYRDRGVARAVAGAAAVTAVVVAAVLALGGPAALPTWPTRCRSSPSGARCCPSGRSWASPPHRSSSRPRS